MRHSDRGQVDPFIVMEVMEAAARAEAAGRRIIHMEIGQPGTPAPAGARRAVERALAQQPLGYTAALGLPRLRQGIAALYRRWYGLDLDPARVVVTPGSSGAFILAFAALFEAGERVAIGYPGYPSYRQILRAMSLRPIGIETQAGERFQPRPEDVPEAEGLILASPGNPSGTVLRLPELAALTAAAASRGMAVVSDEIYHGLSYTERCHTALEVTDEVFVVNSFSKYFSMTGWRVGWMIVPETHLRGVERLAQNMFICPPHASQVAALAALDCIDEAETNLAVYAENRRLMLEGLPRAGFSRIAPPEGAFYIYADVSDLTADSRAFAAEILDRAGVAVTPGLDFDPVRGATTLRFSYAGATADIVEGLARLQSFMDAR